MNESLLGSVIGIGIAIAGILAFFFPLAVTKVIFIWPKCALSMFLGNAVPSQAQEAIHLLHTSPKQYKKKFRHQLWLTRITGIIAIIVGVLGLLISVS